MTKTRPNQKYISLLLAFFHAQVTIANQNLASFFAARKKKFLQKKSLTVQV